LQVPPKIWSRPTATHPEGGTLGRGTVYSGSMKRWCLLVLACLGPATDVRGQEPDYAGFQVTLAGVANPMQLDALDRARRQQDSLSAVRLVERGLIALRRYEITDRRADSDRAKKLFDTATDRYPSQPWAHYGLALALARGPDVRIKSPLGVLNKIVVAQSAAEIVGLDPRSRARRALKRALELDAQLQPAVLELAELALRDQDRGELRDAREALIRASRNGAVAPRIATALANVEASLGNLDAATAAADVALVESPGDASAIHARAIAMLRQTDNHDDGARAYFAAVDQLTPDAADAFFHDVIAIVTDAERAAWNGADVARRAEWLKDFWTLRAARSGVSIAERLAEHYRRLAFVRLKYRRKSLRGADPGEALLHVPAGDKLEYDDRGIIYIRHGKPDEIVSSLSVNLRPNETWVYQRQDGKPQLLHFVAMRNTPDFRLVDNILQAVDMTTTGFNTVSTVQLLEDRVGYEPRYGLMIARLREARTQAFAAAATREGTTRDIAQTFGDLDVQTRTLISEQRAAALRMVESDSDRPRFESELPFFYDIYTFRGENGRTDVTAAMAIPGDLLGADESDGLSYAVRLSLIVLDSVAGRVERVDTVFRFAARRALTTGEHLRTQVGLSVTPSLSTAHRVVASNPRGGASQGQLYGAPRVIPDYSGSNLMLSDIVLAEAEPGGSWQRGNLRLRLVPPRQFPRSRPLSLFYEVYNLPHGSSYRTEIAILPAEAGGAITRLKGLLGSDPGLRFSFEGTAEVHDGAAQELRQLSPDLKPGKYRIRVQVTNLTTKQTTAHEREFVVME
jgi:GWxTD domain-containing protein